MDRGLDLKDIIRMAREARAELGTEHSAILDSLDMLMSAALHAGAAAERKACEQVCEEHWRNNGNAMECADAIRARGEK